MDEIGKRQRRIGYWVVAAVLLVALASVGISEARTMGRMCLFSAVQGVVTEGGKPVAGAVVERHFKWAWKNETGVDRTQTDAQGRFHFDAIRRSSLLGGLLPHQPSVEQQIRIEHAGKSYIAWQFLREDYEDQSELFGQPINLQCDLGAQPRKHLLERNYVRHSIYGLCTLQGVTELKANPA